MCIYVSVEEQASDRYRDSYARDPSGIMGKTAGKKIHLPCDAAERATDDSHAQISCRVAIDLEILVSRMNISD